MYSRWQVMQCIMPCVALVVDLQGWMVSCKENSMHQALCHSLAYLLADVVCWQCGVCEMRSL